MEYVTRKYPLRLSPSWRGHPSGDHIIVESISSKCVIDTAFYSNSNTNNNYVILISGEKISNTILIKEVSNPNWYFRTGGITEAILVWHLTKMSSGRQVIDKLWTFIKCVILELLLDVNAPQTYMRIKPEKNI